MMMERESVSVTSIDLIHLMWLSAWEDITESWKLIMEVKLFFYYFSGFLKTKITYWSHHAFVFVSDSDKIWTDFVQIQCGKSTVLVLFL